MAQSVRWTAAAIADLTEVTEYIAADSPHYAADLAARISDAFESLAEFPGRGRMVPEFGDPNVKEIFVGQYRLIYRVKPEMIYVQAIVHGARDLPRAAADRLDPENI